MTEGSQEHPQRGHVARPLQHRPTDHALQQRSVTDEVLDPDTQLAEHRRPSILVETQPASRPTHRSFRAAVAVDEADDDDRDDQHDQHAGYRCGHVEAVHAAYGDRDQQTGPEHEVEHDRRTQCSRGEGEAGIRTRHPRQRQQPEAECRAGCAAARHDVAERPGAHLDPEHPSLRHVGTGIAESRPGEPGVAHGRRHHEQEPEHQPLRAHFRQIGGRMLETGDLRQDQEVHDHGEEHDPQREPHLLAPPGDGGDVGGGGVGEGLFHAWGRQRSGSRAVVEHHTRRGGPSALAVGADRW